MGHVEIKQSSVIETVPPIVVESLYKISKDAPNDAEIIYLGDIQTTHAHEEAIQYLEAKYGTTLHITFTTSDVNDRYYVHFDDSVFEKVMANSSVNAGGDGVGVIKSSAAGVSQSVLNNIMNTDKLFEGNDEIETIDFRPYTTVYTNSSSNALENHRSYDIRLDRLTGCDSLKNIYANQLKSFSINNNPSTLTFTLGEVIIKNIGTILGGNFNGTKTKIDKLAVWNIDSFGGFVSRRAEITKLYIGNTTPPTVNIAWGDSANNGDDTSTAWQNIKNIYVPQGCLSAYQDAAGWSRMKDTTFYEWDPANKDTIFKGLCD